MDLWHLLSSSQKQPIEKLVCRDKATRKSNSLALSGVDISRVYCLSNCFQLDALSGLFWIQLTSLALGASCGSHTS